MRNLDWPSGTTVLMTLIGVAVYVPLMVYGSTQIVKPQPLLMGIGCENASGPLYAMEEDHFPLCKEIIPYD